MDQDGHDTSLYDSDFYSWTQQQAALLRRRDLHAAELDAIAEEIESLGRSEASALRSSLRLIVCHMLKLLHQPDLASRGWVVTITRERINVDRLLSDNPGLKPKLPALFQEAYDDGRREAIAETGLPPAMFDKQPEVTLVQVRDHTFLPAPPSGSAHD